jgi:hypothetical protein
MSTDTQDGISVVQRARIGHNFTVNGRAYTLASYSCMSDSAGFKVCVFAKGGGTRYIRIRESSRVILLGAGEEE